MPLLKHIVDFFTNDKTVYSHRNRTVEMVAQEKGLELERLRSETRDLMEKEGPVSAVIILRKRFHITTAAAWVFVDRLSQ
jgi:hypothetical protein